MVYNVTGMIKGGLQHGSRHTLKCGLTRWEAYAYIDEYNKRQGRRFKNLRVEPMEGKQ